jgi:hypothetical protein
LPHEPIDQVLSCEAPWRSQPAFASGNVADVDDATDIRSITERRLLFLQSVIRIAIDRPCGFSSSFKERYGFTLFH